MKLMDDDRPRDPQCFVDYSFGFGNDCVATFECSPEDGIEMIISNGATINAKDFKEYFRTWISWGDVATFQKAFGSMDSFYDYNTAVRRRNAN